MLKYLSTLAWRYVFWRAQNDYSIYYLRKVLPVVVPCMLLAYVVCAAVGLDTKLTWLAVFAVEELSLNLYGDAIEERVQSTYKPKWSMRIALTPMREESDAL